jgi:hypothetical protein
MLIFLVVVVSCNVKGYKKKEEATLGVLRRDTQSISTDYSTPQVGLEKSNEEKIREVSEALYKNLVNGQFGPHPELNDSGYYELGLDSYLDYLRDLNIFSEQFYNQEIERMSSCKKTLEEIKYNGELDLGWEPSECFFTSMYWVWSQEKPTGFELKDLKILDDSATSKMVFYDIFEKKSYRDSDVYLNILYRKEKDGWKVNKIERVTSTY